MLYFVLTEAEQYSYSLVWDNTQKFVQARHHSRQSSNKMLMWANAYAARSRVSVPRSIAATSRTLMARHIPLSVCAVIFIR